MSECDHFGEEKLKGKRLHHADAPERQIRKALEMDTQEVVSWSRAPIASLGTLTEEALIFLILHYRACGNALVVEQLAAGLDQRMKTRVTDYYARVLGAQASRELSANVASLAWIIMLEAPAGRGVWSQLCFRRFLHNLARDVLRALRHAEAFSLDANDRFGFASEIRSQSVSPEDAVYLREALSLMKPHERVAFVLQHGFRESQRTIAQSFGRSDRSVRTWLRQAERRLQTGF